MRGLFSQEGTYKSNPVIATNDRVKIVFVFRKILLRLLHGYHARQREGYKKKYLERSEMSKVACGVHLNMSARLK